MPKDRNHPVGAQCALRCLIYSKGMRRDAHRDGSWITMIAQDDVGGLRVKRHSWKGWIKEPECDHYEVKPIPGALLVNFGRALEEFSGRAFPATCHWVSGKAVTKTRVSMPFFYDATDKSRTVGGC